MLILIANSIAYSQPINIPVESKKEIVSTLEAYPVVLAELDAADQLIKNQKLIILNLEKQIFEYSKLVDNKDAQILNSKDKNRLSEKEIKRLKRRNTRNVIFGGAAIIGFILIK